MKNLLLALLLILMPWKGFSQTITPQASNQVNVTNGSGGWTLQPYTNGTSYAVENYGAKGDWNGTTGTDNTTAIQACINALEAASPAAGQCVLQPKAYKVTGRLVINTSSVGIAGTSWGAVSSAISNQLAANVPASVIISTSATADIIDVWGASISAPLSFNKFNDFTLMRTQATSNSGVSGAAGLSFKYTGGVVVDRVWSEDSSNGFYFLNSGAYGTGYIANSGALWGANGFNPTQSVYGFFVDGSQSAESFRLRDSFAQCIYPGTNCTGVQTVGLIVTGTHINDIMVSRFETAFVTYGEYIQSTGGSNSTDSSDIHLLECINDSFISDGIVINGLVEANGASVEINGGWDSSASASYGIELLNSNGVTVSNVHMVNIGSMSYGILSSGSQRIALNGNRIYNMVNGGIGLSTTDAAAVTGNIISAPSGNTSTGIVSSSSTNSVFAGNSIPGYMSYGVTFDAGSTGNSFSGALGISHTHVTTPVQNVNGMNSNWISN